MHKILAPLFLLSSMSFAQGAYAANLIVCDRIEDTDLQVLPQRGAKSYSIEINSEEISLTRLDSDRAKPEVYKIEDPGLYSYYGSDASMTEHSNEKTVHFVRFDIERGKKLSDIPSRSKFKMAITFSYMELFFSDDTYAISDDEYSCKKP